MSVHLGIVGQQIRTVVCNFLAAGTAKAGKREIHDRGKREYEPLVLRVTFASRPRMLGIVQTTKKCIQARGVA